MGVVQTARAVHGNMSDPTNAFPLKLLGCLVKGPLGCLAFLFGAIVVFVVFLPPACGNILEEEMGTWFGQRHEGTLTIEKAWFGSVYGQQKIDGITLRDPRDSKVLEGVFTAPSLDGLFFRSGSDNSWGPVTLHLPRVDLIEYADGTTNLELALARREDAVASQFQVDLGGGSDSVAVGPFSYDSTAFTIGLRVTIERLSWRAATQEVLVLRDIECDGQLRSLDGSLRLEMSGRGVFDGGKPDGLVFDLGIDSFDRWVDSEAFQPWSLNIELQDAPVLMVEAMIGRAGQLAEALGEVVQSCDVLLVADSPQACSVDSLELTSPGRARISAVGDWNIAAGELTAGKNDAIFIGFPVDSWWTREVVGTLLPLMDDVQLSSSKGLADIKLQEYRIPLSGDPWEMDGNCTVLAGNVAYRLPSAVAGELLLEERGQSGTPLEVELADGVANYASFDVPTAKGKLQVRGSLDLKRRVYDLLIRTPHGSEYRVEGPRDDPRVAEKD